jgi:large subunit ribosomal protein L10
MNRQQKDTAISDVKDYLTRSQAAFLVNYKGLTVAQLQKFRKELRVEDGVFKVTKARLMKLAADKIEAGEGFKENFKDQVGLVFALQEAPPVAKVIRTFAKENEALEIVVGYFENHVISKEEVISLASVPSKNVLFGRLAGALQSPLSGLAFTLSAVVSKLAYALDAVVKKKKDEGSKEGDE